MSFDPVWIVGGAAVAILAWAASKAMENTSSNNGFGARDLTIPQARAILNQAANAGQIQIIAEGLSNNRMTIGNVVDEVTYRYLPQPNARTVIDNLDPRLAVLLLRLAQTLKNQFGTKTVFDLGITHGSGNPSDVHNQGRAIDIGSVDDGTGEVYSVLGDWGRKPKGPPGTYRLRPNDRGYDMFRSIYAFATQEATDTSVNSGGNGRPTTIGERSYILHPDTPNAALAPAHQNHFHIQIGPTQVGVVVV